MCTLVRADDSRLMGQRAVQGAHPLGLGVERRLKVFEGKREVQNRHIVAGRTRRRRNRGPQREHADRRRPHGGRPAEQPPTGFAGQSRKRLAHRSVRVEVIESEGSGIVGGHR